VTLHKNKKVSNMDQTPKQKTKDESQDQSISHVPVLMKEVLKYLNPKQGDRYLDLTAGFGGHSAAVLTLTANPSDAVLVDRDEVAVTVLQDQFGLAGAEIMHTNFLYASQQLLRTERQFDVILADLGVSSVHLNEASRGFSIKKDGPLDMRMDQSQRLTAYKIVNSYSQAALAELLFAFGEEPKAHSIARNIIKARPIKTTGELAAIVARSWPGHHRVHPATRTFQALRIAVNDELQQIQLSLPIWIQLLAPAGRIVVISFHSLEDRLVKQAFQERGGDQYDAELSLLTKRPVMASSDELVFNPRARSAKLRAAAKINTQRKGSSHANSG
jgi:16S rRNA (cytosine1402-N4)-methyltransferase